MPLVIDACAAQHQGDRKEQQDRVAILPHARKKGVALAVVADGMGGHTGGALAAEQVIHTARTNLDHFSPAEDAPCAMLEGSLKEAHTMIKASRFINEKDPHSTAVMVLLQPDKVSWVHCGDSRLYHYRGRDIVSRTVDHSYVEHLLATGKITPAEALVHPNRNVLLTSLGGEDAPLYDCVDIGEPLGGDIFVLCSDGLWAYFDDAELGAIVADHSARQACEILIEQARKRAKGSGDNVSVAVIKLLDVEPPKAKPPTGFVPRPRH